MSNKTRKEKIWEEQERIKRSLPFFSKILTWLVGVLLFPIVTLLRPFVKVRIGLLYHWAMGRLCGNTEYFLRLRKLYPPAGREWFVLISGTPVNHQILTMVARKIRVIKSDWVWTILDNLRKRTPDHPVWIDLNRTGWLRGAEWSEPGPQLSFTPEEHARGQALLRKLGVPEGAQHVCIFAKDRFYTDSPDTKLDPNSYWGSRDFRNCDIRNYLPAAKYLAEQGIYVFRMGIHRPEELLPANRHPRIIDYTGVIRPTLDDPEFADVYLQANCKFFLGCTSGMYLLSSMFGVPVAYANMIPYGECGRMPHDLFIVKRCRDRTTGAFIPFSKLIARGLDADWLTLEELNQLEADGIEFVENSSEEILALAKEMNMRLDGRWQPAPEDEELQKKYRAISPARCFDGSDFPGHVGAEFLRQNQDLLN
jgi:putative glycosyltransferase (TIGR04372 family)